jgi:hypothetical protein
MYKPYFMRKTILFLLPLYFIACRKKLTITAPPNPFITQARTFFADSVVNSGPVVSYRAKQPKTIQWDLAQYISLPTASSALTAMVVTSFPDSIFFKNPLGKFTGIKSLEDWQGNPISKLLYSSNGTIKTYHPPTGIGGVPGINTLGGGAGGVDARKSSAAGVVVTSGNSIIQSVSHYFQCFTNVGGSDHSYTVTVCVDQPRPGTRTPWTLTPGGLNGSIEVGNVVNVGHTFLILTETYGATTITRNIGFYPSTRVWVASPSSPGQFNDDEYHKYNISGSFKLNNAQFFNILNFIISANNSSYLYNLNSNNCTTFVLNAMAQAGINLPRTKGTW